MHLFVCICAGVRVCTREPACRGLRTLVELVVSYHLGPWGLNSGLAMSTFITEHLHLYSHHFCFAYSLPDIPKPTGQNVVVTSTVLTTKMMKAIKEKASLSASLKQQQLVLMGFAPISPKLTTLLGHCYHGVVADQAGHKGQGTGSQVFDDCRHECSSQSLFKCLPGWSVLCFVAVRYDDIGNGLFCKAGRQSHTRHHSQCLSPDKLSWRVT